MTKIEWTDEVWNPVTGCSKVSEGCRNCYAESIAHRFWGDRQFTEVRCHPDRLNAPLDWKNPRRVFVNSMSDLFHEDVPDEFIDKVFAVMALTPQHTYQVLTKRPERMRLYCSGVVETATWPLPNCWKGVSVEDQHTADERIPILLQTPAALRWVSYEPALGPIDFCRGGFSFLARRKRPSGSHREKIDWIVVGGESGPQARPCNVAWIRSAVEQCKSAGVPVFVKQMGSHVVDRNDAGFEGDTDESWPMDTRFEQEWSEQHYQGTLGQVRLKKKGGDPAEWPADLRVREYPTTVTA